MRINDGTDTRKLRIASLLFAVFCVLSPVKNAFAAPNITLTTDFTAADGSRTYMDVAGVWDGLSTDLVGDTFTLTIANDIAADTAYDLRDISVNLPAGFLLDNTTVNVNSGGCSAISASASQGGSIVTIDISPNTNINPGCTYDFSFDLETDTSVATGINFLNYIVSYNTINNDNSSQVTEPVESQSINVNPGTLSVTKTSPLVTVVDGQNISFTVTISNTGSGGLFDVLFTDVLGAHFDPASLSITPPGFPLGAFVAANQYRLDYLGAFGTATDSATFTVTVDVDTSSTIIGCPDLVNTANVSDRTGGSASSAYTVVLDLTAALSLTHDASSFCELCGDGTIRLLVENTNNVTLTDVEVTENLLASGLVFVPGTIQISIDGGAPVAAPGADPGAVTSFTWTSAEIPELANLNGTGSSQYSVEIYVDVRRPPNTEEGLTLAVRDIRASATYDDVCLNGPYAANPPDFLLPIQEPIPAIVKEGRNVEAGQGTGDYQPVVYGHENDDIIWRVNIQNTGLADLQDLLIADTVGGNFEINYICFNEGDAETTAITNNGGSAPAGCVAFDPAYPPAALADVAGPGNTDYFYVGRILPGQCSVDVNSVDIEWGCEADTSTGDGGILATSIPAATNPAPGSAQMSTDNGGGLTITRDMRGVDGGLQIGSNGEVTIIITNNTGGTVSDLVLDNLLPPEYVRDTSFAPQLTVVPLYAAYDGMIDTITDTNEQAALTDNTQPIFSLTSSGPPRAGGEGHDANLFRAGDEATIVFRIVLVDQPHFDVVANLDVVEEDPGSVIATDPPNTDPDNAFTVTNTLSVSYLDTCSFAPVTLPDIVDTFQADIEDLDITTSAPLYILTDDPAFPVPLVVEVSNNGGHDANNYYIYVSFGETMSVQSWSSTDGSTVCTSIGAPGANPIDTPARAVWETPAFIPATAEVFRCTGGVISPTNQVDLTFNVIKDTTSTADDLTFRADVVGVIEQDDGTEVVVTPLDATIPNTTSNYTLDAIRSRVMGFNLTKTLPGTCSEDASVPTPGDSNLIIGEDCTYHIEAGGWFGFATPGFTLIEVHSVVVTDDLDDGLGYVQHTFTNDGAITDPVVINGGAGSIPMEETDITWAFNVSGDGITAKDQYFRVDITTRLLNDPVDSSAAPNVHLANTFDIGKASFVAVFDGAIYPVDETLGIPGYPDESVRRVDLTVTEPSLSVVKEVCNETLYDPNPIGSRTGDSCTSYTTLASDGDTQDSYVYRITVTNAASPRAPAYNIISTDTLDASDLMLIAPFDADNLDNDGDGATDEADEATILATTNNIVGDASPAVITVSHTTSSSLVRIDPGASVTFYYRVNPDDAIAPLQTLTNDVVMSYDSLLGDSGNQFAQPRLNSDPGGARVYTTTLAQARVRILPLAAQPKVITAVSNTGITAAPQSVVIGEEILYELRTFIPVAHLRDFKIRDELPAGLRCIQAQDIDLNAAPYSAAGFKKNGSDNIATFLGTCDPTGASNVVEWTFGDQELTTATDNNLFEFTAWFIARVDNIGTNFDGVTITNGGGSTVVTTSYIDDGGGTITLPHASVDVRVREPQIVLTKRFTDALDNDITTADAGDIVTVTVTARNTGTATAYNLQILEDLTNTRMTYLIGNETGVIPDNIDTT
ncbi:MAG: DUF11 domain-containing protein, partial [Gammaproteobacteria bacterium]|nr:DUF11 domain-containing protein [Gammaproteobacteria bacterium]